MTVINFPAQLAATDREVLIHTDDGVEMRTVILRQTYPTPVEDLWEACTTADRLARWFVPVAGDLVVGGHYQLEGNAGGTIEQCEAPRFLRATWVYDERITWLEVRCSPMPEGALLELRHISPMSDHLQKFGPAAVGIGWDLGLTGLALYLAEGEAFDREAAAAAAMGPEGIQAVSTSADAWRATAVAAGDDPVWVAAATQRTVNFFTGVETES